MATKKQKRAAALAKREKFMAEVKASGLAAQKADREGSWEERTKLQKIADEMSKRASLTLEEKLAEERCTNLEQPSYAEMDAATATQAHNFAKAMYIGSES